MRGRPLEVVPLFVSGTIFLDMHRGSGYNALSLRPGKREWYESQDTACMYGLQGEELLHYQEQADHAAEDRIEEVLPQVQEAPGAQGNKVIVEIGVQASSSNW